MKRTASFWFAALGLLLPLTTGCSKHDCKLDEQHEKYFGEHALTTKGANMCFTGEEPSGCKLESGRCSPTLFAWHYELEQKDVEPRYKTAIEAQGWKYVGEKPSDDGSKGLAFSKGDREELYVALGGIPGNKGTEVFMLRKPEGATGSMLDTYKPAP